VVDETQDGIPSPYYHYFEHHKARLLGGGFEEFINYKRARISVLFDHDDALTTC